MPSQRKIVLVQLPSPWLISDRDLPLMGLLYLAARLKQWDVEVQIADLVGVPEDKWYIPEGDVYGFSMTTPQAPLAKKAIELVRNRTAHKVTVIVGGAHVSALPEWSLKHLDADYAFVGESDNALVAFMKDLPLEEVDGLCWYKDGVYTQNKMPVVELDSLPLAARDMVDIRSFHQVGINRYVKDGVVREGYLQTGRGCPYDCAFCAQAAITGRRARYFPDQTLIDDITELREKYEVDLIYIEDDTFNINRRRVLHLCELFTKLDFPWHCLCRADNMDDEIATAIASAGCQNVTFGFETGSPRILKAMRKAEKVDHAYIAIDAVKKAGMGIRGQMIVGFPGETDETIAETEAFVRAVEVDRFGFHAFVPLPGTHVWRNPKHYGLEIDLDSEDFATGFHTIGKPGEWAKVWGDQSQTRDWLSHLRGVADARNIDRPVPGAPDHDKDWAGVQDAVA